MNPLPTELRNKLERTIIEARDEAEKGAKAALEAMAVHHHEPYGHMSPEERKLRNHLRARARQLGDRQNRKGELKITHLVWECAYEHWHRMLFARFLAENDLLIEPEMGVAISLEECEELAKEEGKDLWSLASEFAQRMLPQIFRPNDPVLKVTLAREHRLKLEKLLNDLEPSVFTARDSLGWVYQFWQTKSKRDINESGNKIGSNELPAVTQLFTESYMVRFLIHNTLGAWHANKVLKSNPELLEKVINEEKLRKAMAVPGVSWDYLRFIREDDGNGFWRPAAGIFEDWPKKAKDLKIIDPCCGSGQFLVELLHHLAPLRMAEEGLSLKEAIDSVLRENIHGLEVDERCTQISTFAVALAAWSYPEIKGYRPLPDMQIACSGIPVKGNKEQWMDLAGKDKRLRLGMEILSSQFLNSPVLGSLINPCRLDDELLWVARFKELQPIVEKALSQAKREEDFNKAELSITAKGMLYAASLLSRKYHLVITNVPYLSLRKQALELKKFTTSAYPKSKHDLATVFLERCLEFCLRNGSTALVVQQNWLFLSSYKHLREKLIKKSTLNCIALLGAKAFSTLMWDFGISLNIISDKKQVSEHSFSAIDVSSKNSIGDISIGLRSDPIKKVYQNSQLSNPDFRITFNEVDDHGLLENLVICPQGIKTGDDAKWRRNFWELPKITGGWQYYQSTVGQTNYHGGREFIIDWRTLGQGMIRPRLQNNAVGKQGIGISQMGDLNVTLYTGELYESGVGVIVPINPRNIPAIWAFCSSPEYLKLVRNIDRKLFVTNQTLVKVPFNLKYWQNVAEQKYPNGLPEPYSDDHTQWIFHGHPAQSNHPLQVAVARLLGYRWLAELDAGMELADEQREWVNKCVGLLKYVDEDGIVCIPSVRGEETADGRHRALLTVALGPDWSPSAEQELLRTTGANASNLDEWLRDHFFEQHCKLFHHRPFIWHIWDGRRRDGFHALVNYHKLAEENGKGRQLLENLTYSYLGDWIIRQKEGVKRGEGGAEDRLAAALELQKRLIAIIEGEPPFDIFVRWKPIEEQSIGWEPDINDGVRLNIRPFMAPDMPDGSRKGADIPGGRKGAGILRWKPNIKWNKDRGKEPFRPKEQYPWFWKDGEFTGDRVNDIHLSINDKQKARKEKKQT